MTGCMFWGLLKGRAAATTRAATSNPAAAIQTMAAAAVNMCSSPSDTAFRSGAASALVTLTYVLFWRAAHAISSILESEGEKRR